MQSDPTRCFLAQLNVARALAPLDSTELRDFVMALDGINALAEAHPGFVWRLKTDAGNAIDVRTSDDPRFIVNMSVWRSAEDLFDFVYRSAHTGVMVRRREWFEKLGQAHQVLFWVPADQRPTVDEALERLEYLRAHGPSPRAFTFKARYPAPGSPGEPSDMKPEPYCVD